LLWWQNGSKCQASGKSHVALEAEVYSERFILLQYTVLAVLLSLAIVGIVTLTAIQSGNVELELDAQKALR
jgi:hypothetical protein